MTLVHDILELDLLTLQAHTERAGDVVDADLHRARVQDMLETCTVCPVYRAGRLVAYAALVPESASCWFVRGFNTHPSHRTSAVMGELLSKLSELARQREIVELRTHVYKTNALSMAFHKKLGFHITRENEKAVEFFAVVAMIRERRAVRRAAARVSRA
ncbi:MAG: GNAT family N-acetyltransferase [Janthinobacterium lividum]